METQKILIVDDEPDLGEILVLVTAKKSISVKEVLAKARDVSNKACDGCNTLIFEGLVINLNDKTVIIDGVRTDFTKTEFDLLVYLLKNKGKLFSRTELVTAVWPENVVVTERTVDVNMTRIRKKIGVYATNIVAKTGFGYMFDGEFPVY